MRHVIAALDELDRADARAIEVRREAAEAFDRELRAALAGTVWHSGLHELVRRRERQRPQPVAVAVERVPPPDRADRARNVRAEHELNNRAVPDSGSVRRRQAGVLVVGATEREVHPWLRAAGHTTRVAPGADAALAALGEEPADLVIVDRDPAGLDTPDLCRTLHADPRLDGAWMLAITAKGPQIGRRAHRGRRRLPAPAVHARRAARARRRRSARGAPALRRPADARADAQRARRHLSLGVARRPRGRADQRRDRAHLGLPAVELRRQHAAHDAEHRPSR